RMFVWCAAMASSAEAQDLSGLISLLVDTGTPRTWTEYNPAGNVCGNGTQFRFYVHENDPGDPDNVLFYFEGGGACWTYDGCAGLSGVLGAANPNGISPNYMTGLQQEYASPLVNGADPGLPGRSRNDLFTKDWNVVFVPYCTGDVHVGNSTQTYTDPATGASLTYHHNGYANTQAVIQWVDNRWPSMGDLLVSGYSAGGTGTSANYYFIRSALADNMAATGGRGYYLNDSGPLFPAPNSGSNSRALHDTITTAWALGSVFANIPASLKTPGNPNGFDLDDYGTLNRAVATQYPNDQFAYTAFSMDFNYSRFSYERFLANPTQAEILADWQEDQADLVTLLDTLPNFSYHLPWERPILDSHTSTTVTFIGSHACDQMEKKRYWWEYLQFPWSQTYKCYSEFLPMETFLDRWYGGGVSRVVEPENGYNDEDPGMQLVKALVDAAL
ncbi:MAG: pectin acetylesterase-family hydrolase, partial [Myxococcota bacterium]